MSTPMSLKTEGEWTPQTQRRRNEGVYSRHLNIALPRSIDPHKGTEIR